MASERDPAQRSAFRFLVDTLEPARLIFVDEMGIHCGMTRLFARALGGQRAVCAAPRAKGANTSVIGALGLRGVVAALSVEGAVDSAVWRTFLEQVRLPEVQPGDIIVLDNLALHRSGWVREVIEANGAHVLYLPAYSPDFSPIENAWSKIKESLRSAAARSGPVLDAALTQALAAVTPQDIRGWFAHCGYKATPK